MPRIIIFILATFSFEVFGQGTVYVINLYGTEVMAQPNFDSDTLITVEIGGFLTIQNTTKLKSIKHYDDHNMTLEGLWLQVTTNEIEGYITTSDISEIMPEISHIKYNEDFNIKVMSLLGRKMSTSTEQKSATFSNIVISYEDEITEYERATKNHYIIDGCYYNNYLFPNLSFNEVYHQLRSTILSYGADIAGYIIRTPSIKEVTDRKWIFYDIGLTNQIEIIATPNGFKIESSGCS